MKYLILIISLQLCSFLLLSQDENCNISYTNNVYDNYLSTFSVINNSENTIIRYLWDFGDGTMSLLVSPSHLFLKADTYYVCLTVTYNNGCVATSCDSIYLTDVLSISRTGNKIYGHVYAGNNLLPEGALILISKMNNKYKAIAHTKIINGHYFFNNVPLGKYILYAIPRFNIGCNYFPHYLPTYWGGAIEWYNAEHISFSDTNCVKNCNIQLISDHTFYAGNDSIYGKVYIEDTINFEYNIYLNLFEDRKDITSYELYSAPNQVILLFDKNNKPLNFTLTDLNGKFSIKNLPNEIFKVSLQKHGINSVIYTSDTMSQNFVSFIIKTDTVTINIKPNFYSKSENAFILQNPADSYLIIRLNSCHDSYKVSIYSIVGENVYSEKIYNNKSTNEIIFIPINQLKSGIYFLKINTLSSQIIKTFIKK